MKTGLLSLICVFVGFGVSARGTPPTMVEMTPKPAEVPSEVVVESDGSVRVVTQSIHAVSFEELRRTIPEFVPVWSVQHDGTRVPGVTYRNESGQRVSRPVMDYPGLVVLMPDGTWRVRMVAFSIECGGLDPGQHRLIPGSEDARLAIAKDPDGEYLGPWPMEQGQRAPTIPYTYDHTGAPAGLTAFDVERAIQRVIAHWTQLLDLEGFVVPFEFVWRDDLGANTLMQSIVTGRDFRFWNSVRAKLEESMLGEDVDGWEEAVYLNLPTGSQIQYAWPGGTSNTSKIMLPVSLLNKWFGVTAGDPCRIEMNPVAIAWDLDCRLGYTPLDSNEYNFEAVLIHEVGHHLGFISETESVVSIFYDRISNWDVFRFAEAAGPTISAGEMLGATRELRKGTAAIAGTALNTAARTYPLADGDDYQASHWAEYSTSSPLYIGIMDPAFQEGDTSVVNGKYFQDADIRAFDVMGYEINEDFLTPGPSPTSLLSPSPAVTVAADEPLTLSWSAAANATSYTVAVQDAGPRADGDIVFVEHDIEETSVVVPADTLESGRLYRWYVSAQNWRGFVRTDSTFSTEGGCLADYNGDTAADILDFLDFSDDFSTCEDEPAPCGSYGEADLNGDAVVDVLDFLEFLDAFSSGC